MHKILFNALLLGEKPSGVQYTIENLLMAMSKRDLSKLHIEVLISKNYHSEFTHGHELKIHRVPFETSERAKRIYYEQFVLPRYMKSKNLELYHAPGYILPFFPPTNNIVTVHDLIALDFPDLCKNETSIYFNLFLPNSIKKAEKIITFSQKVKEDIMRRYPKVNESSIQVIYPGIKNIFRRVENLQTLSFVKNKYNLPDTFFLYVGNLEPKKNIPRIVKAYEYVLENNKDIQHQLLIVGQLGWKYENILQTINNSKVKDRIRLMGYLDEDCLPSLYSMADLFLFPSIYEGFGLPVLEAMACGCPIVTSNTGAIPEVSGKIGLFVDPEDVSQLADSIVLLLNNQELRRSFISKGIEWAKRFTWEDSAARTLKLYECLTN